MNILFRNIIYFQIILITSIWSVSAPPFLFEVNQPDGSKIPVRMYGHEYYNWIETEDGYVINWIEADNRLGWYYNKLDDNSKFTSSDILVEYPAPIDLRLPKYLREISPNVREIKHVESSPHHIHEDQLQRSNQSYIVKPLVFLVDFDGLPTGMPDKTYTNVQFQHLLFDEDLNSNNANLPSNYDMSVADYYNEISHGQIIISGDSESVIDWVTADHEYSYYVDGAQGTGQGSNGKANSAASLVLEIAMQVDSHINFSEFDGNGDGEVDVVIIIVEGWGNGDDDQFWPHMSTILSGSDINPSASTNSDGYFYLDGVTIKKYIVMPEQYYYNDIGVSQGYIHPIGTTCHELGHILGLPDLYDTSDNGAAGIGAWGLMGTGNYQRQTSPAYMSAWSRYQLGLINPVIIEDAMNSSAILFPAEIGESDYRAMILPMDTNMPQEYLLLENRQKLGSDQYLKKSGLLAWHIDETMTNMYPTLNSVNVNPDFYGVNLIQADGEGDLYVNEGIADSKDPFPGSLGITELNQLETNSYDRDVDGSIEPGKESGIEIKDIIEEDDGNITFKILNPNQQGAIISYDEGGYGPYAYSDNDPSYDWVGIKFTVEDTMLISGISTIFRPTTELSYVSDYNIKIWKGWTNNMPKSLLNSLSGDVIWSDARNGGWSFISFLDEDINLLLYSDEVYYIEIDFNGTEFINHFDYVNFSNNVVSEKSYFREDESSTCNKFAYGDWNIQAVMSGLDEYEELSVDILAIPKQHQIYSNYPNPFNHRTILPLYLSTPASMQYIVFDLRGNQILTRDFQLLHAGYHEFSLNMSQMSSGVYFYQFIISDQKHLPQTMAFIK